MENKLDGKSPQVVATDEQPQIIVVRRRSDVLAELAELRLANGMPEPEPPDIGMQAWLGVWLRS